MIARALLVALLVLGFQSPTAPRKGGNPEAAKNKNPVAPTPESAAAGKKIYQRLCIRCHGATGKGDGEAAVGAEPADLTSGKWTFGATDGEIYASIREGTSKDMEGYAERIGEADTWNVVNYVRSLAPKR